MGWGAIARRQSCYSLEGKRRRVARRNDFRDMMDGFANRRSYQPI